MSGLRLLPKLDDSTRPAHTSQTTTIILRRTGTALLSKFLLFMHRSSEPQLLQRGRPYHPFNNLVEVHAEHELMQGERPLYSLDRLLEVFSNVSCLTEVAHSNPSTACLNPPPNVSFCSEAGHSTPPTRWLK